MAEENERQESSSTRPRVSALDLAIFNRQLASLIETNLPVAPALKALAHDVRKASFRQAIEEVSREVERGSSLSEALRIHGRFFPPLYVNLIEAGEKSGNLSMALNQIAELSHRTAFFKSRVREILTYPAIVVGVAIAVITFIFRFIVPTFAVMFVGLGGGGGSLPRPTEILIALSKLSREFSLSIAGALLGLVLLLVGLRQLGATRYIVDRMLLAVPIFGRLIRNIVIAQFAQTLGGSLKSGMTLPRALELTQSTSENSVMEKTVAEMRQQVIGGGKISETMYSNRYIPYTVAWMVSVGEREGRLDESLLSIAQSYNEEILHESRSIFLLMEPVLLVFMGLVVGTVVVSLFLPLIQLGSLVGGH